MIFDFFLLMWCMMLIDLRMLNHPCEPGMNPTWSWCIIFLICCWIQLAKILLRIFVSIFIKDIGLQFSFLVVSQVLYLECLQVCSFFFNLLRKFREMGSSSSLYVCQNLPVKPSGPGFLFVWSVFMIYSISFLVISLFNWSLSS